MALDTLLKGSYIKRFIQPHVEVMDLLNFIFAHDDSPGRWRHLENPSHTRETKRVVGHLTCVLRVHHQHALSKHNPYNIFPTTKFPR